MDQLIKAFETNVFIDLKTRAQLLCVLRAVSNAESDEIVSDYGANNFACLNDATPLGIRKPDVIARCKRCETFLRNVRAEHINTMWHFGGTKSKEEIACDILQRVQIGECPLKIRVFANTLARNKEGLVDHVNAELKVHQYEHIDVYVGHCVCA
jgi:hypothetical protein